MRNAWKHLLAALPLLTLAACARQTTTAREREVVRRQSGQDLAGVEFDSLPLQIAYSCRSSVEAPTQPRRAVVEFVVDEGGAVRAGSARVVEISDPDFAPYALSFVGSCRFVPGWARGQRTPARLRMPVRVD